MAQNTYMRAYPCHLTLSVPIIALVLACAPAHADQVDDYMRAQMALNHVPGAAVVIVRDGRIAKLKAYGSANLEWQQAVTADTAFPLASSTKPFTGLLLMRLAEAGKLGLDDSIARYLPGAPAAWEPITVRQLANHSSGIPDDVQVKPEASVDEYIAAAQAMPLKHAPGASSQYGIAGYTVLGKVIEKASGMPFAQALRHYVTAPLGLRNTVYEHASGSPDMRSVDVIPRRAGVYDWKDGRHVNFSFHFTPRAYAAGGLLSSAADLAKVAVALEQGKFLRRESVQAMWERQPLADGKPNNFAAGWALREVNGRHTVGHSGGPALSDILHLPAERATFIVLTNGQSLYPYLAQGISELYFPAPPVVMPQGLADSRPQLSANLRQVIADGMAGKVEEAHFSEGARKDFVPAARAFLLPFFRSLKGFDEFVLVVDKPTDTGSGREYRARHGNKAVTWGFNLDRDGKVMAFGPK